MNPEPVYLDNASTTRVDPAVAEAMRPYLEGEYGNAASKYYERGRRANAAVEAARAAVAALVGAAPEEIFFTSGATEANNWALMSVLAWGERRHAVTSPIEHHAVLEPLAFLARHAGASFDAAAVDARGVVDPAAFAAALGDGTGLASVMLANNEIGTVQDVAALTRAVRARPGGERIFVHTDAVQAAGRIPVDAAALGVDALSLSAHKLHGPKGVGALYLKKGRRLAPYMHGGNQENGRRAGTANVPGIVGFGKAAELALARVRAGDAAARERALVEKLWAGLSAKLPKIRRNGAGTAPGAGLPGLLSVCVEGAEGEAVLGYLDMLHGVQVSSGSACTSGSLEPSHVLLATGVPVEIAHGSIRFSLSHWTTEEEIDRVVPAVVDVVERVRSMSVTWNG